MSLYIAPTTGSLRSIIHCLKFSKAGF